MDPQQISTALVGVVVAAPAVAAYLSTQGRRDRSERKRLRAVVDEWETWATESRRERRLHNIDQHPDGRGEIPLKAWPPSMTTPEDDA